MKVKICTKFFVTMLFIIVMLLGVATSSLANNEYSVSMTLTSNSINFKEGEVITINVNLTNINAGNGIDVLTAKLNYDTNIFEILSSSDFSSNTNWNISFSPNTNMLTAIKNKKVTKGENVFCIRLKVKSNINTNSTNVSLQNIVVSGGTITYGGTGDINVDNIYVALNKVIGETNKLNNSSTNENLGILKDNSYIDDINIDSDNDTYIYEENVNIIDENNQLNDKLSMNENNNTDILKENEIVAQKINTNNLDKNINDKTINVERAIIGSSSSISFISICFYLFRKIKFGI